MTSPTNPSRARHPYRRSVLAGVAVPVLIAGQFAMVTSIPVGVALATTWRNPALRSLRPWAAGLGALYAVPVIMWAIGPDRAPSLSRDMHPAVAVIVSLAGACFALRAHAMKRHAKKTAIPMAPASQTYAI